MGLAPLCLLLSLTVLGVAVGAVAEDDEYTWPQRKVPLVRDKRTVRLSSPGFTAETQRELRGTCGIECQSRLPRPSVADLENLLSYETVYENGTRTLTEVSLRDVEEAAVAQNSSARLLRRHRREVYGTDSRFTIADKHFSTNYPFSTTVKVSTGCSGILVSPKHVLTAAHCIHDGQDYVKGVKRLRVGLLKLRSKRRKGGKGRGGGRKGRRKGEEEGEEKGNGGGKVEGEGEEKGTGGGKGEGEGEEKSKGRGKGERRRGRKNRSRRSAEPKQPSFRWTRVKQTQVPKGWFRGVSDEVAVDYDYALLELKRAHRQRHMDLGVIPSVRKVPAGRIHFSGFDDDRPGQLVYRFCSVSEESGDLLYQYCDAQPGSSGSGVYVRLKEPGKRKWKRKIIGVFSGHHWVDVNGAQQDYNVAVRITPAKYAQICFWMHGDSSECRDA
ncbi:inactive serine protease 35 [Anguilla rostrata]|uniref:inactive serine protease 35 n=1 Tax=Anguilla rostrata TaxID=7938 RepID=UPI0030D06ED9